MLLVTSMGGGRAAAGATPPYVIKGRDRAQRRSKSQCCRSVRERGIVCKRRVVCTAARNHFTETPSAAKPPHTPQCFLFNSGHFPASQDFMSVFYPIHCTDYLRSAEMTEVIMNTQPMDEIGLSPRKDSYQVCCRAAEV
ncbi:hypothetical protein FKM82_010125 [Ascaphus truei]